MRSAAAATGRACPVRKAPSTPTGKPGDAEVCDAVPGRLRWDDDRDAFVVPYELVRTAPDPDVLLLAFLQSAYDTAAAADWDRRSLERQT